MAGHSHWAGIKHKKGRADKERSKIFSKLSREITVAAKLGDKDPDMNHRLRSAIQAARVANMPKDNIDRAINKSKFSEQLFTGMLEREVLLEALVVVEVVVLILDMVVPLIMILEVQVEIFQEYLQLIQYHKQML